MQPDQATHLYNADAPPFQMQFLASASTATAGAQNMPPGFAAASSDTATDGYYCGRNTSVTSRLRIRFVGNVANIAGQTIQVAVLVNGVAIATAILATPLATTAGTKTGSVDFTPTTLAEGDLVRVTITPSAGLTAVLTNVSAVLS